MLSGPVFLLPLLLVSCNNDCESGLFDLDGECVTSCAPGYFLGIDGRCHPIESPDGDGDWDRDVVDADVDSDDVFDDADPVSEGDPDTFPQDRDLYEGCLDLVSCAALAQPALDRIVAARRGGGCDAGSLVLDPGASAAAHDCVELMVADDSLEVCSGTARDRLAVQGIDGFVDIAEVYSRHRTIVGAVDLLITRVEVLDCRFAIAGLAIGPSSSMDRYYVDLILIE